jgi:hypothetical protein
MLARLRFLFQVIHHDQRTSVYCMLNYHSVRNLFMDKNSSVRIVITCMIDRDGNLPLGLLSVWVLELFWRR